MVTSWRTRKLIQEPQPGRSETGFSFIFFNLSWAVQLRYIYIYIYIYIKIAEQHNPNRWIYYDVNVFGICFPHIWSFGKNKYQIHFYVTVNMDDFKTVYIYESLLVVANFSINGRFCLVSLGNPTFSNIFPRARHVLMTFELWTLCARLFRRIFLYLLLSSQ